jgi:hypothetical protein
MKTLIAAILLATTLSAADLTLTWQDNSDNEAGFEVYRKVNDGQWELIAATNPDTPIFNDAVIPIGAVLRYRVRAWNQFGESDFTNEVMIGTFPPAAPSGLKGELKRSNTNSHLRQRPGPIFKGSVKTTRDRYGRLVISGS